MNNEQPALPSKLYKYVASARIDILEKETIKFSTASKLNDPFEMRPRFSPSMEAIRNQWREWLKKKYASLPSNYKISWPEFERAAEQKNGTWEERMPLIEEDYGHRLPERYHDAANSTIGILCLSEHTAGPDNLLMWAHYAQRHTGLVFQFNTDNDFFRRFLISISKLSSTRQSDGPGATTRT